MISLHSEFLKEGIQQWVEELKISKDNACDLACFIVDFNNAHIPFSPVYFTLQNPECSNGKCGQKFDFLKRRHHCRRCGQIFCAQCCQTRVMLPRMCFVDPVRQCFRCSDITNAENVFFNSSLKLLTAGGSSTGWSLSGTLSWSI